MVTGDHNRPSKRRRLPPEIPAFSSFARYVANSRVPSSRSSPNGSGSKSKILDPQPEPVPHPPAKAKLPYSSSASSSSSSSDDDEEEVSMETVQADFGFFDPKPGDFAGVKLLLQTYLDDKPWDLSGFVDLILEQTTVGTVVKLDGDGDGEETSPEKQDNNNDDDEGIYAVVSALNIGRYSGQKCIAEFKKHLTGLCNDDGTKQKLRSLLEEQASDVGLLVSQRFVNCPHQLVPPLYDALFDEVSWATEDEPTQELQDSFRFKDYLLVTKIYEKKNVTKPKAGVKRDSDEPIIYLKAEDEIFHELSLWSFTFRLHAAQLAPPELKNYNPTGLVMLVKADKVPMFRTKLKALLEDF